MGVSGQSISDQTHRLPTRASGQKIACEPSRRCVCIGPWALLYFIKLDDYTELIKHIIICVNNILENKKQSNIQQTLNVYIDLKDTKTKNIDYEFIKTLIQFLSAHYEDNLDKMYFRNAKIMFKTIYKVIRPFIPKSTRKKIYFEKQTNNNNNIQIEHISECEYGDI